VQDSNGFFEFIKTHRGQIIGIGLGMLVGVLILTIGFFRTLFLAICVGIGAFFGTKNKFRSKLFEILDKILPDIFR
jgi:uncharacterized membrane protein